MKITDLQTLTDIASQLYKLEADTNRDRATPSKGYGNNEATPAEVASILFGIIKKGLTTSTVVKEVAAKEEDMELPF